MPQGVFLESNRDECTVSLVYAVHLEKQGSVSFTYQYPDNNIFFEFYVSLRPPPTISSGHCDKLGFIYDSLLSEQAVCSFMI